MSKNVNISVQNFVYLYLFFGMFFMVAHNSHMHKLQNQHTEKNTNKKEMLTNRKSTVNTHSKYPWQKLSANGHTKHSIAEMKNQQCMHTLTALIIIVVLFNGHYFDTTTANKQTRSGWRGYLL